MAQSRRQFVQNATVSSAGVVAASFGAQQALAAPGGNRAPGASVAQSGDKEPVTVKLWTHDQNYIDFFTRRAEELSESADSKYTYTLDITQAPSGDLITKALAGIAAGQSMPDLIGIEISSFARFMENDVAEQTLVDLTDRIADIRDQFYESRWAVYSVGDKVYGVESAYPLCVYYYRQDIFEADEITAPIGTWDEVTEIGTTVTKPKDQAMLAVSTSGGTDDFRLLQLQRGGGLFDADGNLILDSPESVEVLEFLVNGYKAGAFLGLDDGSSAAAAMQQGRLVAVVGADWYQKYILEPTVPDQKGLWRIQPIPTFSGGGSATSVLGGTGFAIGKDSPAADAAWELLQYSYLTYDGQLKRWQEIGYLPTMKEVWNDPVFEAPNEFLGGQASGLVFKDLAPEAPTPYQNPNTDVAVTRLQEQLAEVFNNDKSPQDAIADAAAAIQAEIG